MQTRNFLARLINSKATLVTLVAAVILALAGTTYGYSALSTQVTLSLDGQSEEVSVMGDTVGDVLDAEGIEVGDHDQVAPDLDEEVTDGTAISVRFGRPLELSVDGDEQTYWTTATDVGSALTDLGLRFAGADLSVSRGGSIDRDGLSLDVVTEKTLQVKIADKKFVTEKVAALTARDAIKQLGVEIDQHDQITPGGKAELEDGDKVVFTDIRVVTQRVKREVVDFTTVEREDGSMFEGETSVARSGEDGLRDVTYRITYRNGELVARKVLRQEVLDAPVSAIVDVGTKEVAPPTSRPAAPSGTPSRSASPAATGPSTPATATTAGCSSASARGRRTAAPATRTSRAARRRSRSPRRSAPPPAATAPGRTARSRWACPSSHYASWHDVFRRSETPRAGGSAFPGGRSRPASHQAARAELRHRPQHRAPDRARVAGHRLRRGRRGGSGPRLADPGAA